MIDRYDIQALIDAREEGEGFSIESNPVLNQTFERGIDKLSEAISEWSSKAEPRDAWGHNGDTPMLNSGYHFANDTFIASAYDWSDNPMDLNFYHFKSGVDVSWYKHAWRGAYGHSKATLDALSNETFYDIIDDCIRSLDNTLSNELIWDGLFEEQPSDDG